jgi:hypothetical protein
VNETIRVVFSAGIDVWAEHVDWPSQVRIPVAGETVNLPKHGGVTVHHVDWRLDLPVLTATVYVH